MLFAAAVFLLTGLAKTAASEVVTSSCEATYAYDEPLSLLQTTLKHNARSSQHQSASTRAFDPYPTLSLNSYFECSLIAFIAWGIIQWVALPYLFPSLKDGKDKLGDTE